MLTGRRPFGGDTPAEVLSSIIKDTAGSVSDVVPGVSRDLAKLVKRCLAKDPIRRYQSAIDLRNDLEELKEELNSVGLEREGPAGTFSVTRLWLAVVSASVVGAVAVTYLLTRSEREDADALNVATFNRLTSDPGQELHPSLSPDGKSVLYEKRVGGDWDIFLLRVGGQNPVNLTKDSPADDIHPAFSPDGEQIAFRSEKDEGGIFIMGATGESARRLTDFGYDPAWSPDGSEIVVASTGGRPGSRTARSELWSVHVSTGEKRMITTERANQPQWSPEGHRIAYSDAGIWSIPAAGGERVKVTPDGARYQDAAWSPDGDYLYFSSDRGGSSNLWRVPIAEQTGETLGPLEAVTSGAAATREQMSISGDASRIAYVEKVTRYTFTSSILTRKTAPSTTPSHL